MPPFITIASYTLPTEAAVVKSKLESEGIACFLKDELTVQAHNFYSNAVGGVKLQVQPEDKEAAIRILKESGFFPQAESTPTFIDKFAQKTSNWPILGKMIPEIRLIIILLLIAVVIIIPIAIFDQFN